MVLKVFARTMITSGELVVVRLTARPVVDALEAIPDPSRATGSMVNFPFTMNERTYV